MMMFSSFENITKSSIKDLSVLSNSIIPDKFRDESSNTSNGNFTLARDEDEMPSLLSNVYEAISVSVDSHMSISA